VSLLVQPQDFPDAAPAETVNTTKVRIVANTILKMLVTAMVLRNPP
jgi:hypothetical protein